VYREMPCRWFKRACCVCALRAWRCRKDSARTQVCRATQGQVSSRPIVHCGSFLTTYHHACRYRYVFYIDATSATTIEADLKSIALAKGAGDNPSDALTWLARLSEEWLMVYNNADDTTLELRRYFPTCSHGKILVTTRNRRIILLGQGVEPHCHVSEMSRGDGD
jgi:hypothetical protein